MKKILLITIILILFPTTTLAQFACGPRNKVLNHLFMKFNEVPKAVAITGTGLLIELFVSKNNKTWTILTTRPGTRTSCVIFAGDNWKELNTNRNTFDDRNL